MNAASGAVLVMFLSVVTIVAYKLGPHLVDGALAIVNGTASHDEHMKTISAAVWILGPIGLCVFIFAGLRSDR